MCIRDSLPPKHLILGEISKIVIPGGVYIGNFWEFFNFSKWFHTEVAPNDPQWWIFPKKCLRLAQNGQFWSLCSFSHFFPKMKLRLTGNGQFHLICNFSNLLPPKWLRMTWNSQFHLIHNFSNLFPPKWLRMTQNGQLHPIRNFSHLLPPKHLILGEISKIFVSGGGTSWIFWSFSTFVNRFAPKWLKMTHNGEICKKVP